MSRDLARAETATATDRDIRVGALNDRAESAADDRAESATDRLGVRYVSGASGGDRFGTGPAPQQALDAVAGPGRPLPPVASGAMREGFGRDFSHVRIHDGPAAAEGARSIGADAYALGSDIAFAQGAFRPETGPGLALLSHEIAHTTDPGSADTIRRDVGFFEQIARFFGHGTFSDAELKDYLARLAGPKPKSGRPEDETGQIEADYDGDNKARAVVEKKMHIGQSVRVRKLLIDEMFDGVVTEADEEAVIQILEDAAKSDLGGLIEIVKQVGSETLQKELTGKEYDKLMELLGRIQDADPKPPVPLDWSVNYTVSNAPAELQDKVGVFLNEMYFTPDAGTKTPAASNLSVPESDTTVATDKPHPRDTGGELSVAVSPGKVDGGAVTPIAPPQAPKLRYPVVGYQYDRMEVMLDLYFSRELSSVDKTGTTTVDRKVEGKDTSQTKGSSELDRTGTNVTTGQDKKVEVTQGKSSSAEVGVSAGQEEGAAARVRSEESDVDLKHKQSGKQDVDLTSKTTGKNVTEGSISIDLDDIEFDATVKSELKGEAEVSKGKESIARKLKDLTEPVRRKIIDKVLKRYLGPASGQATEGIEYILDKLVGDPPDWTITLDAKSKSKVSGSVSGEVTGKWREIQTINQKTETGGTIKSEGEGTTTGKIKSGSAEVERNRKSQVGASAKVGAEKKTDVTVGKTDIHRKTEIDEHEKGTFKSDTTTDVKRKETGTDEFTGKDTYNYSELFDRVELRVRLSGNKGRYFGESKGPQRGGGRFPAPERKGASE